MPYNSSYTGAQIDAVISLLTDTLTNGQLAIGSTGTTPVAATVTGTANEITVTNGAGSITLSLPGSVTIDDITLNNGQVAFPASQNASADANTLDDYEEGTYTVTITPLTSGTITLTAANNTGSYVKVGEIIHVQGLVNVDSVSSPVGNAKVSLPVSSATLSENSDNASGSIALSDVDFDAATASLSIDVGAGVDYFTIRETKDDATWTSCDGADFGAGSDILFQITYRTA